MKCVKCKNIEKKIILNKDLVFNIVLESPKLYREYLSDLKNQLNGENDEEFLTLFDGNNKLQANKNIVLIENLLSIELDDKKINTLIQKEVSSKITIAQNDEYLSLQNAVNQFVDKITYDYDIPLTFDRDMSLSSLFKYLSLQFDFEDSQFLEKLIKKIKLLSSTFKYNIFIFINLFDYLIEEEILLFKKEMNLLELDFFVISSHENKYKIKNIYNIIIDDDLCEIHIENND